MCQCKLIFHCVALQVTKREHDPHGTQRFCKIEKRGFLFFLIIVLFVTQWLPERQFNPKSSLIWPLSLENNTYIFYVDYKCVKQIKKTTTSKPEEHDPIYVLADRPHNSQ